MAALFEERLLENFMFSYISNFNVTPGTFGGFETYIISEKFILSIQIGPLGHVGLSGKF